MYVDQACIDTLLGRCKELISFWRPRPNVRGHTGTLKCPKLGFHALSSKPVDGFKSILHRHIIGRRGRVDYILVTLT